MSICPPRTRPRRDLRQGVVPLAYFNGLSAKAEKRNIPFEITIEDVERVFEVQGRRCALSGHALFFARGRTKGSASVDRRDSREGYTPSNIQIVHKTINRMKSDLSEDLFLYWSYQVTDYQRKTI